MSSYPPTTLDAKTFERRANLWTVSNPPPALQALRDELERYSAELIALHGRTARAPMSPEDEAAYDNLVKRVGDLSNSVRSLTIEHTRETVVMRGRSEVELLREDNQRLLGELSESKVREVLLQSDVQALRDESKRTRSLIDSLHWQLAQLRQYLFIAGGLLVISLIFSALVVFNYI